MNSFKIGDVYVFTGNYNNTPHYDNFDVNVKYTISNLIPYDGDELSYYPRLCIIFSDAEFGTYDTEIDKYFKPLHEYRRNFLRSLGF